MYSRNANCGPEKGPPFYNLSKVQKRQKNQIKETKINKPSSAKQVQENS